MKKINIVFSCAVSASLLVACAAESTAPVQSSRLKVATAKPVEQVSQTPPATLSISIDKPTELISCADVADKAYRQSILDAVNEVRKTARSCGGQFFQAATPLTWNDHLTQSAQEQANDMANAHIMAHYGATGMDFRQRIKITGYKGGGGENIASGQKNVAAVMRNWVELSPGHCANIMRANYTHYALACAEDKSANNRSYWAQHFGSGR